MKTYTIEKLNTFTYSLLIHGEYNHVLYEIINKLVKSSHYDDETNKLYFTAENVVPYKKYLLVNNKQHLTHYDCIKLITDSTTQIDLLEEMGFTFYGFDIDDMLTIDNTFLFVSANYLIPIYNKKIVFCYPIEQPYFSSPEILKLTTLPAEISYKTCYYSLGLLIVYSLLHIYLLVGNEIKSAEDIDILIEPIKFTKEYWFVKRCINDDAEKRILLLI